MKQRKSLLTAVAVALALALTIFENGQVAGMIYVPVGVGNKSLYLEHWILFPNYVSPSPTVRMDIVPNRSLEYANEQEFFRAAPWGPGYRYVKVLAHDTTHLPGR